MVSMVNRLSTDQRAQIVSCLCEGMSIRATVRVTGAAKNTISKLLVDLGRACAEYQDGGANQLALQEHSVRRNLVVLLCQGTRTCPTSTRASSATAMCGHGRRSTATRSWCPAGSWVSAQPFDAEVFMRDLASRLANRVQLTTDGLRLYMNAVEATFAGDIDYAMLHKIYNAPAGVESERRYSPAVCTGVDIRRVNGDPDLSKAQHVVRGAPKPHHADGYAPLHPAHQRFQQKGGEPGPRSVFALHALQLRAAPTKPSPRPTMAVRRRLQWLLASPTVFGPTAISPPYSTSRAAWA